MRALKLSLNLVMFLIYAFYAAIVLYFPFAELISYVGRETNSFMYDIAISKNDVILPAFIAAFIYAGVTALLRRLEVGDSRESHMSKRESSS